MQPSAQTDEKLASIERHLVAIEHMIEHQNIAIAQLRDELAEAKRRDDWYHVQFSEMVRILARDLREMRATLICSVVGDGPLSTELLQVLMRQTPEDRREVEAPLQSRAAADSGACHAGRAVARW